MWLVALRWNGEWVFRVDPGFAWDAERNVRNVLFDVSSLRRIN
jgi:hypothetical protein